MSSRFIYLFIFLIFTQDMITDFGERRREGGREGERNIYQLSPICALTGDQTNNLLRYGMMLQSTELPGQDGSSIFRWIPQVRFWIYFLVKKGRKLLSLSISLCWKISRSLTQRGTLAQTWAELSCRKLGSSAPERCRVVALPQLAHDNFNNVTLWVMFWMLLVLHQEVISFPSQVR